MSNAIFTPKKPVNEPVKDYVAGSFERIQLDEAIAKFISMEMKLQVLKK